MQTPIDAHSRTPIDAHSRTQGCLAHQEPSPPPQDYRRAIDRPAVLQGPKGVRASE